MIKYKNTKVALDLVIPGIAPEELSDVGVKIQIIDGGVLRLEFSDKIAFVSPKNWHYAVLS